MIYYYTEELSLVYVCFRYMRIIQKVKADSRRFTGSVEREYRRICFAIDRKSKIQRR